jgi:mannose-6-phosphate isomerase class I
MKVDFKNYAQKEDLALPLRKSSQFPMPPKIHRSSTVFGKYDIYPAHALENNKIFNGYHSLSKWIIQQKTVVIDGFVGVLWNKIKQEIQSRLVNEGLSINWVFTADYLKPATVIEEIVQPFLGTYDSVWGTKTSLNLKDFYEIQNLAQQLPDDRFDVNILIGPAAALSAWNAPLIYIDLPKNELQFRMRCGSISNLGNDQVTKPFQMYKRFYFVDWVVLNEHKKAILDRIEVIADGQWLDDINWIFKATLAEGLNKMSRSVIRVRPWFEPGIWGGQWIKEHINGLNKDVINYAWSFELIVPENGLVFESSGHLLEVSFDFLMFHNQEQVLGKHAAQYGDEFPIRFDFLDTWQGDNLSIQCHPKLAYMKEVFGENITQDETYYILDCEENAKVYLGFQENINPEEYRNALEKSQAEGKEIAIEDYVQAHTAKKHDLFLIPNSTVHSAGAGNLVLEISATPYIFTFKMYDWVRLDMDGNPRPINIDHAFNNLDFSRKGDRVQQELISKPEIIAEQADWQHVHVPTHPEHFYDVHRIEFDHEFAVETDNCCHVMMLVEGQQISIETLDGTKLEFAYAETFVVPAAAKSYVLTNLGKGRAKVIKAFLK